jgi:hypothetical protein
MFRALLLITLCCLILPGLCQQKTITAIKTSRAPKIDANLDDAAWQEAPVASDFVQNFPTFGLPATVQSDVHILYDNDAVYIGAYLHDDPKLIRKQLTSRDGEQRQDVDYFSVFFDTYNDQQNGFQFLVTTANVQSDARIGGNSAGNIGFGDFGDKTWDAVWQSEVRIVNDGWIVEMRIPYISLRFSKKTIQTWGLQFLRYIRRDNESSYWNPVDPKVNGFPNQFGKYEDLQNIEPPLRLSFSPYLSGGVRVNPDGSHINTEWLHSGGMDVKYGINESFTLDATLIPDFGQVVSDDVINNLSPFEVRFQENRPFFTEGTELFNKSGLFYSRRVAATPTGYQDVLDFANTHPDYQLLSNPTLTQLINGIKFSGRTKKKLGIGVFNAVTAPMEARLHLTTTGKDTIIRTEELTNYNLFVLDQALKGRSSVTFTNTNVMRNGTAPDANVSAFDFSLYDNSNNYRWKGTARYSKIFGQNEYDGYNTSLGFGKVGGKWQYNLQGVVISDNYNPRDLGYLLTPNQVVYSIDASYNEFTPTDKFLRYSYRFNTTYTNLYKPYVFSDWRTQASVFLWFKNFWDVTVSLGYIPDQHDYFLFGAPYTYYARRPAFAYATVQGSSDSRKRLFFSYNLQLADFFKAESKRYHIIDLGLRYRFSDQFTLDLSHRYETETNYIVYAGKEMTGEPIIGFVDFKDVTSVLSGVYNFTSRLNLTVRARHYWSHVPYNGFANVDENGNPIPRVSMIAPTTNSNVNIFNLDAFLTWDFRLGSRMIVGYKNWLGDNNSVDGMQHTEYLSNLRRSFDPSHGNELTVKVIYFLDYNQFRKKKG